MTDFSNWIFAASSPCVISADDCDRRFMVIGPPLLTAPYGYETGDHVTLTTRPGWKASSMLEDILWAYSCHAPAIPKILACLEASNRYDCTLQTSWFRRAYAEVVHDLRMVGVELKINRLCPLVDRPELNQVVRRTWNQIPHPPFPTKYRS